MAVVETRTARRKRLKAARRATEPAMSVEEILREMERLRNKIIRVTCSEPWTERCRQKFTEHGFSSRINNVPRAMARLKIYPPPAENTPMRACQCDRCHGVRLWPPQYINSRGYSTECAYERMSDYQISQIPPSPGIIDMGRLKAAARAGREYHQQ